MDVEQILQEYGLSEKESIIYITLLQLGTAPVHRIANKANIQRTTTYDVLKSLKEEGLVSFIQKDRKTYFEAAPPSKLLSILKEKQQKVSRILPQLNELKESAVQRPNVTVYEGKKGLVTILEDILHERKDFLSYASKNALYTILQYYFPNFINRRIKAGIRAKLILNEKPIAQKLTDYRILKRKFHTSTFIYGNKVAMLSLTQKEPIGVLIENKEIAATQRIVFDEMWKSARKLK